MPNIWCYPITSHHVPSIKHSRIPMALLETQYWSSQVIGHILASTPKSSTILPTCRNKLLLCNSKKYRERTRQKTKEGERVLHLNAQFFIYSGKEPFYLSILPTYQTWQHPLGPQFVFQSSSHTPLYFIPKNPQATAHAPLPPPVPNKPQASNSPGNQPDSGFNLHFLGFQSNPEMPGYFPTHRAGLRACCKCFWVAVLIRSSCRSALMTCVGL